MPLKKYNKPEGNAWEQKDLRISKISIATNRIALINSLIQAGVEVGEAELTADEIIRNNYKDEKLQDALTWIYAGMSDKMRKELYELSGEERKKRYDFLNNKQTLTQSEAKELAQLSKDQPF